MFSSLSPSILFGLGLFTSEILQHRPQCNSSLWKLWLPKIQPPFEFPGRLCESHIYQGEAELLTWTGSSISFPAHPQPRLPAPRPPLPTRAGGAIPRFPLNSRGNRHQSLLRCSLIRMRVMEMERKQVSTSSVCSFPTSASSVQPKKGFDASRWGWGGTWPQGTWPQCPMQTIQRRKLYQWTDPQKFPGDTIRSITLTLKSNVIEGKIQGLTKSWVF